MTIPFIDLKTQREKIHFEIETAIKRVLDHGQFILGPEIVQLESELSQLCDVTETISCSNGTDALTLILRARNIGLGDAVIIPNFTMAATAEVVVLAGATPIMVDVLKESGNIDPKSAEEGIKVAQKNGLKPKAIIAVDLYGVPAEYDALEKLCDQYKIDLICDAAQSLGGAYRGRKIGGIGIATSTSFYPAKALGCYGDGGAVLTNDEELATIMKSIREHGKGSHRYDHVRVGFNARMDTLQAAILLEKLKIFPEEIELRNDIAARYHHGLKNVVDVPQIPSYIVPVWAQYTIQLRGINREKLMRELGQKGIPTAIHYPKPLHKQLAYRDYPKVSQLNVSETLAETVLSLPMHAYLDKTSQDFIIENLISLLNQKAIYENQTSRYTVSA